MFLAGQYHRWVVFLLAIAIVLACGEGGSLYAASSAPTLPTSLVKIAVSQTPLSSPFILLINWAFLNSKVSMWN